MTQVPTLVEPIPCYTAITFAPVQGFIEKSRKLRDLFGASLILSHLSKKLVEQASQITQVISPGLITVEKGMPNRILIKGEFSKKQAEDTLLSAWKNVLEECRIWLEDNLREFRPFHWEREWTNWGNHTWELFWGQGETITAAMQDLETSKLSRAWIAVNWIGESSSLTGIDAIAWPGLGAETRNPKHIGYSKEKPEIERFYNQLAKITENPKDQIPEGKFIDPSEKLSIPELVKRLVTLPKLAKRIGMECLEEGFKDIVRKPSKEGRGQEAEGRREQYGGGFNPPLIACHLFKDFGGGRETLAPFRSPFMQTAIGIKALCRLPSASLVEINPGQWTGWFMGDGDKVGKHLQELAEKEGDEGIKNFTCAMRNWGKDFYEKFPKEKGRVIYAGGDDFLGVIYSENAKPPIQPREALEWLMNLKAKWQEHQQPITLSVGFVWAAPNVPQRDVLQHCREAEKIAKNKGRDRVTIRVVFNSGQYVQWTCPWEELHILTQYEDREGGSNWGHVYKDLAHLKARHAISIKADEDTIDDRLAIALFNIYFNTTKNYFDRRPNGKKIVENDTPKEIIQWISDLINVGWQLCSNT
jgi:CRISPR-associated protein Cmr2